MIRTGPSPAEIAERHANDPRMRLSEVLVRTNH
jgi:hypothetical protein